MDQPFRYAAKDYDRWFEDHPVLFQSELDAIRMLMPAFESGIEIGVGTGRFASVLGIKNGLEPLDDFARFAKKRGIEVVTGIAEEMPFTDGSFDLALMVTVDCFLTDLPKAFSEIHRILKSGGTFLIAFLDKNGAIARKYKRSKAPAYRHAHFHSPEEISSWMSATGFGELHFAQTLFEENQPEAEAPKSGFGQGSFVAIAGTKKVDE